MYEHEYQDSLDTPAHHAFTTKDDTKSLTLEEIDKHERILGYTTNNKMKKKLNIQTFKLVYIFHFLFSLSFQHSRYRKIIPIS